MSDGRKKTSEIHARLAELITKPNESYGPTVNSAKLDACAALIASAHDFSDYANQCNRLHTEGYEPKLAPCTDIDTAHVAVAIKCITELAFGAADRRDGVRAACMMLRTDYAAACSLVEDHANTKPAC